jgi:hypothetical protein
VRPVAGDPIERSTRDVWHAGAAGRAAACDPSYRLGPRVDGDERGGALVDEPQANDRTGTAGRARRKDLRDAAARAPIDAGIYRIVNRETGTSWVGSTCDLRAYRNRFEFARSTGTPQAFEQRIRVEAERSGVEAVDLEVLEVVTPRPDATADEIRADLAVLEEAWRQNG